MDKIIKTTVIIVLSLITTGSMPSLVIDGTTNDVLELPVNKIFIHTDKDVYQPGETLWFKCYVLKTPGNKLLRQKNTLAIKLTSLEGNTLFNRTFSIKNGTCSHKITIPGDLKNEPVILSGNIKKHKDKQATPFKKLLDIRQPIVPELFIDATYDQKIPVTGDVLKLNVKVSGQSQDPVENAKIKYKLVHGSRTVIKDKIKTNSKGMADISMEYNTPDTEKPLFIKLKARQKRNRTRMAIPVPMNLTTSGIHIDNDINDTLQKINQERKAGLNIKASLDKQQYTTREKVTLTLETKGMDDKPCMAELSVSAINVVCYNNSQQNIYGYLTDSCNYRGNSQFLHNVFTMSPSCKHKKHYSNYNALPGKANELYSNIKFNTTVTTSASGPTRDYETYRSVLDIIKEIKQYTLMGNKIVFAGFVNSVVAQVGALIVIDGIKYGDDANTLNSISPGDIQKINIYTDPVDIHRFTGLNTNGVIEIITKKGERPTNKQVPEENFLSPVYEGQTDKKKNKDLRTTLYWDSEIITGKNGEATITFYNGDIKNKIIVIINGVSNECGVGSEKISYTIK